MWGKRPADETKLLRDRRSVSLGTRLLFVAAVPLDRAGRCRVRLRAEPPRKAGGGPPLWESTLVVPVQPAPVWGDLADLTKPPKSRVVAATFEAALPTIDGDFPIRSGAADDAKLWTGPLPGSDDPAAVPPLALTLTGGTFTITSGHAVLDRDTADRLLARWWVNGKEVPPGESASRQMKQQSRGPRAEPADHLDVGFALPRTLGPLRPGDEIGLQVLYCPDGSAPFRWGREVRRQQTMVEQKAKRRVLPDGFTFPTATNRLTFKLTPDLLATKDYPTTALAR